MSWRLTQRMVNWSDFGPQSIPALGIKSWAKPDQDIRCLRQGHGADSPLVTPKCTYNMYSIYSFDRSGGIPRSSPSRLQCQSIHQSRKDKLTTGAQQVDTNLDRIIENPPMVVLYGQGLEKPSLIRPDIPLLNMPNMQTGLSKVSTKSVPICGRTRAIVCASYRNL